jgi:hypothetical protein
MSCGEKCKLPFEAVKAINIILGEKPQIQVIQNYIAVNLMAKSMVHPPMLYGKWGSFRIAIIKQLLSVI